MKKFSKCLIVLFAFSVIALGLIISAPRAEAADVYYELYETESDELPFYVSTNEKLVFIDGNKKAGYVKLLKDASISETYLTEKNLTIDLNGNTLNHTAGKLQIGNSSSQIYNYTLTIKNGTYNCSSGQAIQPRYGTSIVFENLDLNYTYKNEKGGGQFIYGVPKSLNVINSKITVDSTAKWLQTQNSSLSHMSTVDPGDKACRVNFINSVYTSPSATSLYYSNNSGTDTITDNAIVCFIGSASGFDTPVFNINNTVGSKTVYIQRGVMLKQNSGFPTAEQNGFSYVFVEDITEAEGKYVPGTVIEEAQFIDSGNTAMPYRVCKVICEVTWVYYDENGTLVQDTVPGYADGDLPEYDIPIRDYFVGDDGLIYFIVPLGWSATEGSTVADAKTLEGNVTLYAVYKDAPAAFAHFDSEGGELIEAYFETELTLEVVDTFLDGHYVMVQKDLHYVGNEAIDGANSFILDLGGNSLSFEAKTDAERTLCTPNSDKVVTVKNGILFGNGTAAVSGKTNGRLGSDGSGTIILEDVYLKSVGASAVDMRTGMLVMNGGMLKSILAESTVALGGSGSGESNIILSGVEITAQSPTFDGTLISVNAQGSTVYDATVEIYESTVSCGTFAAVSESNNEAASLSLELYNTAVEASVSVFDVEAQKTDFTPVIISEGTTYSIDPASELNAGKIDAGEGMIIAQGKEGFLEVYADANIAIALSIADGFTPVIYIPETCDVATLAVDGVRVFDRATAPAAEYVVINGQKQLCYTVVCDKITPTCAAREMQIKATVIAGGGAEYNAYTRYSVIKYLEQLLDTTPPEAVERLAIQTLVYIKAANEYFAEASEVDAKELARLTSLLEKYAFAETELPTEKTDTSALAGLVKSAQYTLGTKVNLKLNLTEEALGKTVTVTGKSGKVYFEGEAKEVINVSFTALQLCDELTLTVGEASAQYGLSPYLAAVGEGAEGTLSSVLKALYGYSEAAKAYKEYLDNSLDFGAGDTPITSLGNKAVAK